MMVPVTLMRVSVTALAERLSKSLSSTCCPKHSQCALYASTHISAQNWFPKSKRGLVGSIVLSGYGYGSLIWFPIQVRYKA